MDQILTIRIATLNDLDAVANLFDTYRQFYEQEPDLNLATEFIRARMQANESVILMALNASNEPVGFCQLYPSFCSVEAKPIYVLYDLFVAPEGRRGGVGTALLQVAQDQARTDGKARLDLTTAKTNAAAQAAYEALGWVRDQVFFAYSKRV
jgi:ribosomal protein S18 acetylase RimI-like enzyme